MTWEPQPRSALPAWALTPGAPSLFPPQWARLADARQLQKGAGQGARSRGEDQREPGEEAGGAESAAGEHSHSGDAGLRGSWQWLESGDLFPPKT